MKTSNRHPALSRRAFRVLLANADRLVARRANAARNLERIAKHPTTGTPRAVHEWTMALAALSLASRQRRELFIDTL